MLSPSIGRVRSRLPSAERRQIVLDSAGAVFGERGFAATRLTDIATVAGVTKPILFRHFESKVALYLAVLARHQDVLQGFADRVPQEEPVAVGLRNVLHDWFAYMGDHDYVGRMLFRDSGGGPEVEAFRRQVAERARTVLAEMIGRAAGGAIPGDEIDPLAEFMSSGMAGVALWSSDDPTVDRDAIVNAAIRLWAGLLVPARGA